MTSGPRDRAAGVRSTRQRGAIVRALRRTGGFRTAQALHHIMLETGERVGLATVYRNLQALAEAGEIDTLLTDGGETLFRLCEGGDHHHHLVCRACGHTVEVQAEEVESWAAELASGHGFREVTHTVEIFGVCRTCTAP